MCQLLFILWFCFLCEARANTEMAIKFAGTPKQKREAFLLFLQNGEDMTKCENILIKRIELVAKLCAPELPDQFAIGVCHCAVAACASQLNLAYAVQLCISMAFSLINLCCAYLALRWWAACTFITYLWYLHLNYTAFAFICCTLIMTQWCHSIICNVPKAAEWWMAQRRGDEEG